MKIKVYLLDVSPFLEESEEKEFEKSGEEPKKREFCRLCAMLSLERQKKIQKFRYMQGKCLSLGVGLLLDYGLGKYGLRERDVILRYGPDEKPYLRDYPDLFFNLSHSGNFAMAAFARREIGCDVEQVKKPDFRVVRRFFAPEEAKALEEALEQERDILFYRFWTLKESFLKVTGKGIRMPLNEFCIHLGPPVWAEREGRTEDYGFWEFSLPGYQAALCAEGERESLEVETELLSAENTAWQEWIAGGREVQQ